MSVLRLSWRVLIGLLVCFDVWAGSITHHQFESPLLGRAIDYNLYTPDGYDTANARYPVLYLLHGNLGTEYSWAQDAGIKETADALIAAGSIPAQLIVMPRDPNFWWTDSELEASQSALVQDLIPHVDSEYRTLNRREARAIGGYSAGGFGAANVVLRYPHLFAAAALLSPAVYAIEPPATSSGRTTPVFQTAGEFDRDLWQAATYGAWLEGYKATGIQVPLYVNSGDHDRFDIAFHAALFFQTLREYQAANIELRIFDGDHNFAAWSGSVGDAMIYMAQYLTHSEQ